MKEIKIMKNKVVQEILLIATLSVGFPTAVLVTTVGVWWECEPITVLTAYLLGIVLTAIVLGAASIRDEVRRYGK